MVFPTRKEKLVGQEDKIKDRICYDLKIISVRLQHRNTKIYIIKIVNTEGQIVREVQHIKHAYIGKGYNRVTYLS